LGKLTARKVETTREPGLYGDGEGLYLKVSDGGGKSWILRTRVHGKPRKYGLGSVAHITLAEARTKARELRGIARQGADPAAHRKREVLTFREAAKRVHEQLVPTWRSEGHAVRWWGGLEKYAMPKLGDRDLSTIGTHDVLEVLSPIWAKKNDTAQRIRQRMAAVFQWAKGAGHYFGENPANAVAEALPRVRSKVKHMEAMPWQDVPAFMLQLAQRDAVSARALEFLILTAKRSGEVRGARWAEIDGDVWTIPAERMKMHEEHRVPLTPAALAVLEAMRGLDPVFVFPSPQAHRKGPARPAGPMSDMVFKGLFLRMERAGLTAHGFRTSFRTWAQDSAKADRDVAEACLAHAEGNAVVRAYARSDLLDRRRVLMEAWDRYCTGRAGQVVELIRA
jgi:integrase